MRAEIKLAQQDRRAVFGFAPASQIDEAAWHSALNKSCSGTTCKVAAGQLIEFAAMDEQKEKAIGIGGLGSGYWLGVQVSDAGVWKKIASGSIDSFQLDLTPGGLVLDFDQQKTKQGVRKMIDEQTAIEKGQCCPLVSKCLRAVESASPAAVSKSDYESALDALAKSHAEDSGLDHATAYCEVLETDIGRRLYAASVGVVPAPVHKAADSEAWMEIHKAAQDLQFEDPALSEAAAIERVMQLNPELYDQYLAEQA